MNSADDMPAWIAVAVREFFRWWTGLSPVEALTLKALVLVLWLMMGGAAAYYMIRVGLGHQKFDGHWYTADQWSAYLYDLDRREREGRALQLKEARLLEKWRAQNRGGKRGPRGGDSSTRA